MKLPEKSTIARTLWERVRLLQYTLRRSLGGVHGTYVPYITLTQFFKRIETKVSKIITTLRQKFEKQLFEYWNY